MGGYNLTDFVIGNIEFLFLSEKLVVGIPVIVDTDIGHDVDDVWALAFTALSRADVKLITTTTGDTLYRARLTAKLLENLGATHIPIGVGIPLDDNPHTHQEWLGEYDLDQYPVKFLTTALALFAKLL